MEMRRFARLALAALAGAFSFCVASAQDAAPAKGPDYELLAAICRCREVKCLDTFRERVGNNKLAKIVYFEKWILLEPSKVAGEGLLRNFPVSAEEEAELMSLSASQVDPTKPKADIPGLAEIYDNWPRSIADAVLVFPQYLPVYIRYGMLATNDVHSDYTRHEERVCHADKTQFQTAFERLDRKTQDHLRKQVFDPEKCRAIFFSEGN